MKALSHSFSVKEKIAILIMVLILMALGYYYFVDQPVKNGIKEAAYQRDELQAEYDMLTIKVMQLLEMESELDGMDMSDLSYMESYNASKEEMAFLNDLLQAADQYNISFSDVTKDGDQIRRPFTLQFTASSYQTAKEILKKLYDSPNRCLIADVALTGSNEDYNVLSGDVSVSLSAFFYETMVGGTPDSGLPVEKNTQPLELAEDPYPDL